MAKQLSSVLDKMGIQLDGLESILEGAIAEIDGDEFAKLTQVTVPSGQVEPISNSLYEDHQAWLQTVH